jgi:hypothetical protein
MAEDRSLLTSTMETDPKGYTETQTGQRGDSSVSISIMDNPVLVADAAQIVENIQTNSTEQSIQLGRMEVISNYYERQENISSSTAAHMMKANRSSTNKAYNRAWKRWSDWCRAKGQDPEEYDINHCTSLMITRT